MYRKTLFLFQILLHHESLPQRTQQNAKQYEYTNTQNTINDNLII